VRVISDNDRPSRSGQRYAAAVVACVAQGRASLSTWPSGRHTSRGRRADSSGQRAEVAVELRGQGRVRRRDDHRSLLGGRAGTAGPAMARRSRARAAGRCSWRRTRPAGRSTGSAAGSATRHEPDSGGHGERRPLRAGAVGDAGGAQDAGAGGHRQNGQLRANQPGVPPPAAHGAGRAAGAAPSRDC